MNTRQDSKDAGSTEQDFLPCLDRRRFLVVGGAGAVTILLGELFPGRVFAQDERRRASVATYPRRKVGSLRDLELHKPVTFYYPYDEPHCSSMLVRLGTAAGGGVGPGQDIVAFSQMCTHQGGLLEGQYQSEYRVLGPCPLHLSTFDLTRHGMIVAAHATENLPQIVLELEGDNIYATGVLGLIYGYSDNRAGH